jgi:hypothetical protein
VRTGAYFVKRKDLLVLTSTLLLVAFSLSFAFLYPAMSANQRKPPKGHVPNRGSVRAFGLGVYREPACANAVSSLEWGIIEPGSMVNKTIYLRNEGNSPAIMALTTANWNPSVASSYIGLSWNYTGQTMDADQVIPVLVTLSVSNYVQGITAFSFDALLTSG